MKQKIAATGFPPATGNALDTLKYAPTDIKALVESKKTAVTVGTVPQKHTLEEYIPSEFMEISAFREGLQAPAKDSFLVVYSYPYLSRQIGNYHSTVTGVTPAYETLFNILVVDWKTGQLIASYQDTVTPKSYDDRGTLTHVLEIIFGKNWVSRLKQNSSSP